MNYDYLLDKNTRIYRITGIINLLELENYMNLYLLEFIELLDFCLLEFENYRNL